MESSKQRIARERNWKIHQLCMIYGQAIYFARNRCELVREAVEDELRSMGAKTMQERQEEWRKEFEL